MHNFLIWIGLVYHYKLLPEVSNYRKKQNGSTCQRGAIENLISFKRGMHYNCKATIIAIPCNFRGGKATPLGEIGVRKRVYSTGATGAVARLRDLAYQVLVHAPGDGVPAAAVV